MQVDFGTEFVAVDVVADVVAVDVAADADVDAVDVVVAAAVVVELQQPLQPLWLVLR